MATPLAVQLYTFRTAISEDRNAALARTKDAGFSAVEPFGVGGFGDDAADRLEKAKNLRAQLDDNGLTVVATHGVWSLSTLDTVLEEIAVLGTNRLIAPAPGCIEGHGEAMQTSDGVKRFADALNASAEQAAAAKVQIGYHNHAFEWATLDDGSVAYDLLVERLDPRVFLEVDVYWAATAGQDPAALISRYDDRVRTLHVKDGPAVKEELQVPIGSGSVDNIAAIRAAGGVEYAIVELDDTAGDPFDAAKAGAEWLVAQGAASW